MGNSLNCASGKSAQSRKAALTNKNGTFVSYAHPNMTLSGQAAPDILPIEAANFARERRLSKRSNNSSSNPASPSGMEKTNLNNNDKPEVFTFETAFRLAQLQRTSPMATTPIEQTTEPRIELIPTADIEKIATSPDSSNKKYNTDNCYVNIKPFMFPLPPVPTESDQIMDIGHSEGSVEMIPQEDLTPPSVRRPPLRLSANTDFLESLDSPKLPPRPARLSLMGHLSANSTLKPHPEADLSMSSGDESTIKSPPPRKSVGFTENIPYADGCDTQYSEQCRLSGVQKSNSGTDLTASVVKKRPRKPPRNYSYKASTLPKRISHTTEEVMQLWDEVRKALSLEKLNDTTSLHISEEDDDDIDEIYQNLYAARMRSWQIMCLAQDIIVERLKPDRVWECFLSESLISENEIETMRVCDCNQQESNQLIIDRILEHGDGWFDRLRELLRIHEDQKQISNLLEALNDVFIIGAKANKWTFSLTTKHCSVQQARPRSISEQPDLIGDTAECLQPIVSLEVYDENFGNTSCTPLGEVLRKYNVISHLNLGKNRLSERGMLKLSPGIQGNRCLEKLNLRLNPLQNAGLEVLSKAMCRNGSIRELILCHTHLQTGAGVHIADMLANNSSLEFLDLSYNELSDDDCEQIKRGLEYNHTLKTLNLRGNQISERGCEHLASALTTNMHLQTLDISHNTISDCGASALCLILAQYDNLRELHMEKCGVTSAGCVELADALTSNYSLAALYLSNNAIGDQGCEALADFLATNNSLQTLYLNLCSINRAGLHRLLVVLCHDNFSLRTVGVCNNNIEIHNDDLVQDGFEAVDIRNALNRALEYNTDRKILSWGKAVC